MHQPIVVLDVETLGLLPLRHRVIEVSAVRVEPGAWDSLDLKTYRFLPTEEDMLDAEPKALEVNGYRVGHPDWKGRPECGSEGAREAWEEIAGLCLGAVLVNQNVQFDANFIWEELRRHEARVPGSEYGTPYSQVSYDLRPWEATWDVQMFSKRLMKDAGLRGWKLGTVYDLCKGPELPPHRAEADVLRALWVLAHGVEKHPALWPDFKVPAETVKQAVLRRAGERVQ